MGAGQFSAMQLNSKNDVCPGNEAQQQQSRALFRTIECIGILRRFQNDLHDLTGLPFDLVDLQAQPSLRLQATKRFVPFCKLVRASPAGRKACGDCDTQAVCRVKDSSKAMQYVCHLGLVEIVVPLVIHGRLVAVLASGQFLMYRPAPSDFVRIRPIIRRFGVDLKQARQGYFAIPVINSRQARAVEDLITLLAEYLLKIEGAVDSLRPLHDSDKLQQVQQLIESRYGENISLEDMAGKVQLSPCRLAHLFREKLNTTFVAYRNERRIERAKFLLANTSLKIIEVALESGFPSQSHFNQVFCKHVLQSPSAYRKANPEQAPVSGRVEARPL